jgi:hypothetical protein
MALGNNSSSIYLDLRNGKVYRYSKTNEPGTTATQTAKGETRYFYIYDFVEGHVTNFSTREEDIQGKLKLKFQIHLKDGNDDYVVKMDVDSSYFRMFCSVIPNIDWNFPVRLIPRIKEEQGVKKSSLITVNNGKPCKFAFTKDNPNGKPEVTFTKNKKGEVIDIDREEEQQFFFNLIADAKTKLVHPAVAQPAPTGDRVATNVKPTQNFSEDEAFEDDDLPF